MTASAQEPAPPAVAVHVVPSTAQTIRSGFLDPSAPPVATVASGDLVQYPDTWTHWGNEAKYGMSFAEREPFRLKYPQGPYSMMGPVVVDGARPGDVVEVRLRGLRTIDWGWNSFPLGVGALPADFTEPYLHYFRFDDARTSTDFVDGITLPLAPFLGVVAAEPAGDDPVSAIVSGAYGGNLVLRDLTEGSSLFLPVQKDGARIWIGDVHALQGDGVVDQTAIETAAELIEITYVLHRYAGAAPVTGPVAQVDGGWLVVAFADDLDDALVGALRAFITWLNTVGGVDPSDAYALASMAVSFRVTQYAHQTGSVYTSAPPKTVHALLPDAILPADLLARIDAAMRPGVAS